MLTRNKRIGSGLAICFGLWFNDIIDPKLDLRLLESSCVKQVLWVRDMHNTPLIKRLRPGFYPKFENCVHEVDLCSQSVFQILSSTSSTPPPSSLHLCVAATSVH